VDRTTHTTGTGTGTGLEVLPDLGARPVELHLSGSITGHAPLDQLFCPEKGWNLRKKIIFGTHILFSSWLFPCGREWGRKEEQ
jgi:hypothetical protein